MGPGLGPSVPRPGSFLGKSCTSWMTCRAVITAARLTPPAGGRRPDAGSEPLPVGRSHVFPCGLVQASSLTFLCYFVKREAVGLACRPRTLGAGSVNNSGIAQFCQLPWRLPGSWELGEPSPPPPGPHPGRLQTSRWCEAEWGSLAV